MENPRPFVIKYKVVKTESQYLEYSKILTSLSPQYSLDEIELLQLLLEKWESPEHINVGYGEDISIKELQEK